MWKRTSLLLLCLILLGLGCEDDNDRSSDATPSSPPEEASPSTDPNVVVAMGDSITAGTEISGPSYPEIVAQLSGKRVINEGRGGALSSDGSSRIEGVLERYNPYAVMIMYGVNDIIHVGNYDWTIGNLRTMIRAAKDHGTVPIVGTIPPRYRGNGVFDPRHKELNRRIRSLVASEGARLADVESEFGENPDLLLPDGIHPNEDGNRIVAMTFYEALP